MDVRYTVWIAEHVPDHRAAYCQCGVVTEAMATVYPELTRVRGHYHCAYVGPRAHWWLTAPDGTVVDPTVQQFADTGGELCYAGAALCSEDCRARWAALDDDTWD